MTTLQRVRVKWNGFIGAPGVSTFYATSAATLVPQLHTFFAAIAGYFPTVVSIQVENTGDELEDTTGALVGSWNTGAVAPVTGTGGGPYSAVSGALVQWFTDTVLSGRRLRGHTFMVPMYIGAYDASGQLVSAFRATGVAAAAALVTAAAGNMRIWQRPRLARAADGSRPAITARSGGQAAVTASGVRAIVTELRSRRD